MRNIIHIALLSVGCTLAASSHAQAGLTAAQGRNIVAPLYQALNAGSDSETLIKQATSAEWLSCSDDAHCKPREKVLPMIAGFGKAIPDLKWEIKEVIASGNRVVVRGEASGTPAANFMGVPHGGKGFHIMSIDVHTIENGQITRTYHLEDWMGAVRQLRGN